MTTPPNAQRLAPGSAQPAMTKQSDNSMSTMKTKNKRTGASAMTATNPQLCRLYRDNQDAGDFNLMTDSWNVWLSEQPMGEPQKCSVKIPRAKFNKLIRWYISEQKFIRK